jgi:putative ABC transport system permease protein
MLRYYCSLAVRSLRRDFVLSTLTVFAIAMGVALTMTAYTILYVLARDPIPSKSRQLFAVQIDNGGPRSRKPGDTEPPPQMSWIDASALLRAHQGSRETAMYEVGATIVPDDPAAGELQVFGRATTSDFFGMFQVPLMFGSTWSRQEDATAASVVVITRKLNDRLFGGKNSVGGSIRFNEGTYRIVGVLGDWDPKPRFYDVIGGMSFEEGDQLYLPLSNSIDKGWETVEYEYCSAGPRGKTFADLMRSECVWLQYWVELPNAAQVEKYHTLLINYSREQQSSGRFTWEPNVRLRNVRDWLVAQKVVPDDAKLSLAVALTVFLCCVVSAFALMLGKVLARGGEFGIRRAMGASLLAIFYQTLVEAAIAGLLGGALGACLSVLSLHALRGLSPGAMGRIAYTNDLLLTATVLFAVLATLCTGIYPACRAARLSVHTQLKGG